MAAAYGATHLLADSSDVTGEPAGPRNGTLTLPGVPIPPIPSDNRLPVGCAGDLTASAVTSGESFSH